MRTYDQSDEDTMAAHCKAGDVPHYRDGVICPKTGRPIPLDKFSCSKWSDKLWLIYCPSCRVLHWFECDGPSIAKAEQSVMS